jgi:hypothetical protein
MAQLLRIRDAVWFDYISGYYTYAFACDVLELLLGPRNILRREK